MSSQKQKGWGSLLSGAVAGLESRLDSILAEDDPASAKVRTSEEDTKRDKSTVAVREKERSASRISANGRLQDRLAKAVAKGGDSSRPSSRISSEIPSRTGSPGLSPDVGRASVESRASDLSSEIRRESEDQSKAIETLKTDGQPENTSEASFEPATRASTDAASSKVSLDIPSISEPPAEETVPGATGHALTYGEDDVEELRRKYEEESRQRSEEMHAHMERIDALQSKLQYLAKSAAEAARQAKESADAGSLNKKLAEKEERIALLMDEGQSLSKKELQHMSAIKKLRADASAQDKRLSEMKKRLDASERSASAASERARRAEFNERQAAEKAKVLGKLEADVEQLRVDRESAASTIADLRRQLMAANDRAADAENRVQLDALDAEKCKVTDLTEQLENASIEKKLAEDRSRAEVRSIQEHLSQQQEKSKRVETELRTEISNLEGKLEFLRTRSEEVSSSERGDSPVKLLRQIETLQTQYAVARENWQGIESMLNSRLAAVEKEREEVARRESELRKRARDANTKARHAEEELETANERIRSMEIDAENTTSTLKRLQSRLDDAVRALGVAREEFERDREAWKRDTEQRIEEERSKLRMELASGSGPDAGLLRIDSPSASFSQRKTSGNDLLVPFGRRSVASGRTGSSDAVPLSLSIDPNGRPSSRRPSIQPSFSPEPVGTPQRQDSFPSSVSQLGLGINGGHGGFGRSPGVSATPPSIHTIDPDDAPDTATNPHRTIADMLSISTVGAGPSVQLVERMSAAVRRLEAEKAAYREEMSRIATQRDEAREEVVALMGEVEQKRGLDATVAKLEADLKGLDQRYETTLQMYGEKSERVEELENDVMDLKKMLRELAESTVTKR